MLLQHSTTRYINVYIFHATNLTTQRMDSTPPPVTFQLIIISPGPTPRLQVGRGPLVVSRNGHLLPPGGWLYPCCQLMAKSHPDPPRAHPINCKVFSLILPGMALYSKDCTSIRNNTANSGYNKIQRYHFDNNPYCIRLKMLEGFPNFKGKTLCGFLVGLTFMVRRL